MLNDTVVSRKASLASPSEYSSLLYRRPSTEVPTLRGTSLDGGVERGMPAVVAAPLSRRQQQHHQNYSDHERDGASSPKDLWRNKVLPPTSSASAPASSNPIFTSGVISSARGNASTGTNIFATPNTTTTTTTAAIVPHNYNKSTAHRALFESRHTHSTFTPFEETHKERGWRTHAGTSHEIFTSRPDRLQDQMDISFCGQSSSPMGNTLHEHMNFGGGQRVATAVSRSGRLPADGYVHTPAHSHHQRALDGTPPSERTSSPSFRVRGNFPVSAAPREMSDVAQPSSSSATSVIYPIHAPSEGERGGGQEGAMALQRDEHKQQRQHDAAQKLLKEVEALASELKIQRAKRSHAENTVDRYERLLGPADKFAATQVHLREELVKLRSQASKWVTQEQALKSKVADLERALSSSRSREAVTNKRASSVTNKGDSSMSTVNGNSVDDKILASRGRLENLQNRLGVAFIARTKLLEELKEIQDLSRTYEAVDVNPPDDEEGAANSSKSLSATHHSWLNRGRVADVELRLRNQDHSIASLQNAIEMEKECLRGLGSSRSHHLPSDGTSEQRTESPSTEAQIATDVVDPSNNSDAGGSPAAPEYSMLVHPGLEAEVSRLMQALQSKNEQIAQMRELLIAVAKSGKIGVGESVGDLHRALQMRSLLMPADSAPQSPNKDGSMAPATRSPAMTAIDAMGSFATMNTSFGMMPPNTVPTGANDSQSRATLLTTTFKKGEEFINQMVPPNTPTATTIPLPMDTLTRLADRDESRLADILEAIKEGRPMPHQDTEDEGATRFVTDDMKASPLYTVLRASERDVESAVEQEIEYRKSSQGPLSRREEELVKLYERQIVELRRQLRARDAENIVVNRRCTEVMLQLVAKNERISELEKRMVYLH